MIPIDWNTAPGDTKVCYCNDVSLDAIKDAIRDGAATLEDLQAATGACTGNECESRNPSGGCCETDITKILAIYGIKATIRGCGCCNIKR